jgi:hypothetical protein
MLIRFLTWIEKTFVVGKPKVVTRHCMHCKKAFKTDDPNIAHNRWAKKVYFYHRCHIKCYEWVRLVPRKDRDSLDYLTI